MRRGKGLWTSGGGVAGRLRLLFRNQSAGVLDYADHNETCAGQPKQKIGGQSHRGSCEEVGMLVRLNLCALCFLVLLASVCSNSRVPGSPTRLDGGRSTRSSVPPPLEARDCGATAPNDELPDGRFARDGGRTTEARVRREGGALTLDDIAQGRDLSRYDRLNLSDPRMHVFEKDTESVVPRARMFLWEHWRDRRQAYLAITMRSVDAASTSHVFVEQDESGRWRVAMRIVRHLGEIDDCPTSYRVEWVTPGGWRMPGVPLHPGEQPDPAKHELEFRDRCGDMVTSF